MMTTVLKFILFFASLLLGFPSGECNARDSFAKDMTACLFCPWIKSKILDQAPSCNAKEQLQLCYGDWGSALFVSCYNTAKKTPDYTAYAIKKHRIIGHTNRGSWVIDHNVPAAKQATNSDYTAGHNDVEFGFNMGQNYFLARSQLTPYQAFNTKQDRDQSHILTNAAPQWERSNAGNWARLADDIKRYASAIDTVYVFAGVSGSFKRGNGNPFTLGAKNVQVPAYFWKAICQPKVKSSIVFVVKNNVGDKSSTRRSGCNGISMRSNLGIVKCMSMSDAKKNYNFDLPPFNDVQCGTKSKGTFLDSYLNNFS